MMNNNPILMQQLLQKLNQDGQIDPITALNNNLDNLIALNDDFRNWGDEQNKRIEQQYRTYHPFWAYLKYDAEKNPLTMPLKFPYMIKAELENLQKNYINPTRYGE